ncbi:PIG-L family deacetylase [Gordonia sp. PP30]|uniref:PIG-L family deacetylase n=1 Tax=Gordonia sp. PP30 TaxID=2935861 RepID=UPI001FFED4D1|nr:PIG-L family deacetylase [Gordonia sp. PP30]UQE76715.1 PIG-L family deacetylase [Gordonia sp. PP30]
MPGAANALFVHAHPDDESLWTGGTIAELAARGGQTSLITCTWAEGTSRHRELVDAVAALGMAEPPIMLGYADCFVPESAPGAPRMIDVPFDDAVRRVVEHIRRLRPDVIVTYNAYGIYGHPDHMHAHRLAVIAADAAAIGSYAPELGAPWRTKSLYFATLPKATVETLRPYLFEDSKIIIAGTAPDLVDVTLDLQARLGDKVRAINAHKTEVARSASMQNFMKLPRDMQRLFLGWESYRRRDLVPGGCDLA